jgi:hypothetical protein
MRQAATINLMWGVKGMDHKGVDFFDAEQRGELVWDDQFDLADPKAQQHLLDFCPALRAGECNTKICRDNKLVRNDEVPFSYPLPLPLFCLLISHVYPQLRTPPAFGVGHGDDTTRPPVAFTLTPSALRKPAWRTQVKCVLEGFNEWLQELDPPMALPVDDRTVFLAKLLEYSQRTQTQVHELHMATLMAPGRVWLLRHVMHRAEPMRRLRDGVSSGTVQLPDRVHRGGARRVRCWSALHTTEWRRYGAQVPLLFRQLHIQAACGGSPLTTSSLSRAHHHRRRSVQLTTTDGVRILPS